MSTNNFVYKNSIVSYHKFGYGNDVLVAFHGYNQTGLEYKYFEEILGKKFTIIAIDFFWHGESAWLEKEDFLNQDMQAIVSGIAKQEDLHAERFSVCSYSMGARLARALVQNFAPRIDYYIMLSPPTFSFNTFLNFSTNNYFGLNLFRYFTTTPGALQNWVKRLYDFNILTRSVYVFTSKFVGKQERIEKVFKTWYAQRKLRLNFTKFAKLINKNNIEIILIVGKNDTITPPKRIIEYVKKLKNHRIFILEKKHELATPETKEVFKQIFC
ncbi:MAG: alpha/beta hydrolase [Bacteroidia bacterium]|nr:alpha/beta hydrolase [Bacteroidia bacterium]MBP9689679.1 alpha/beta hydrolase [Bacteroidia bacterium]